MKAGMAKQFFVN